MGRVAQALGQYGASRPLVCLLPHCTPVLDSVLGGGGQCGSQAGGAQRVQRLLGHLRCPICWELLPFLKNSC